MASYDIRAVLGRLGITIVDERRGELIASCPYHEDGATPNWSISDRGARRGYHWCFSCASGGRLWQLVAHVRGYEGDDDAGEARAIEWLDKHGDRQVDREMPEGIILRERESHLRSFRMPAGVVFASLDRWVTPPRRYIESRGINAHQVDRWGLGYGIGGRLDRRIVIPVRDDRGEVVNYMARLYAGEGKRYLYPKSEDGTDYDVLFGEQHWPTVRERKGMRLYLTEGALNALAVERVTLRHIAALGGSNIRSAHVLKLGGWGEIVDISDPDEAGDKSAAALFAAIGRHARVIRVRLPEGTDANGVHPEVLRAHLRAAGAA